MKWKWDSHTLGFLSFLVCAVLIGFCNLACGDAQGASMPAVPPKEKFFRGNIVTNRLDNKKGMVVGKKYVTGSDGTAHDCWKYQVRFPAQAQPYVVIEIYEFELDQTVLPERP